MDILDDRMAETMTLRLFPTEGAKNRMENFINPKSSAALQEMPERILSLED